jgi:hypothetical protein
MGGESSLGNADEAGKKKNNASVIDSVFNTKNKHKERPFNQMDEH